MMGESGISHLILTIARVVLLGLAGSAVGSVWLSFFPSPAWIQRSQCRAETAAS